MWYTTVSSRSIVFQWNKWRYIHWTKTNMHWSIIYRWESLGNEKKHIFIIDLGMFLSMMITEWFKLKFDICRVILADDIRADSGRCWSSSSMPWKYVFRSSNKTSGALGQILFGWTWIGFLEKYWIRKKKTWLLNLLWNNLWKKIGWITSSQGSCWSLMF